MTDFAPKPLHAVRAGDVVRLDGDRHMFRVARADVSGEGERAEVELELHPLPDGPPRVVGGPARSMASVLDLSDHETLRIRRAAACATERGLWAEAKGKHPGHSTHNPQLWNDWMNAAKRVQELGLLVTLAESQDRVRKGLAWK
jgi:hypothetical protein